MFKKNWAKVKAWAKRGGWLKPAVVLLFMLFSHYFAKNFWGVLGFSALMLPALWIVSKPKKTTLGL